MPAEVAKKHPRGSLAGGDPDANVKPDVIVSAVDLLRERRQERDRERARENWAKLRNAIRHTIDAVAESDKKEVIVSHGIHFLRSMNHIDPLVHAMYIPCRKEYLTCDGKNVHVFYPDGRKKDIKCLDEPMDQVAYATLTEQFVGWQVGEDALYLMTDEMDIISQAKAPGPIMLGTYNHNIGEMVTVGPNFITNWGFRYGARHLIPRVTSKTNFGADNMFTIMVLEQTASRHQRVFFALHTGVVVFNLFEGKMLCHKKELHVRTITAMTFVNPLKNLVTGSRDGSIKIWDDKYHVKMVFVGHSDCVNALALYPHGPAVVSASLDCTIRVWNLETSDEVDRVQIHEPVEALGTENNYDVFFTWTGRKMELWKVQHLYYIHTAVGSRVASIQLTNHPGCPQRAVLICKDSSIRIVSPPSGAVITTLLMDRVRIIDAAYAIAQDTLFVALGNGDILKCSTATNPCKILARWSCPDPKEICNCLLVYEYVVDYMAKSDIWGALRRNISTKSVDKDSMKSMDRTLLLGGRKDGYICVFDWNTGEVHFKVEAHGSKGVLNLIANSKEDQLISAGMDNVIKIWRLYPYAEEALAPLMSFYCAHTPAFMTTIKTDLCVAFQDPSTATFSVVVYNLKDKNRFDHKPDDDHIDLITGLTSCPRMKLYASCSMDGTIRIWNEANRLVRLLKLNAYPHSLGFCSPKGDLLVGIEDHLFLIPHHTYMSKAYRNKMVTMKFVMPKPEDSLPYDDGLLAQMDRDDVKRLKYSRSSYKFSHFVDVLTPEEEEEVMRERKIKKEAFALLDLRETELKKIRDGELKSLKKGVANKRTQEEAFTNYMKMYYDKPRIELPNEQKLEEEIMKERQEGEEPEEEEGYRPLTTPYGFFNETHYGRQMSARSASSPLKPAYYPHGPHGYIPNSILIKLLWPEPPSPEPTRVYQPPSFSEEDLAPPAKEPEQEAEESVLMMKADAESVDKLRMRKEPQDTPYMPPDRQRSVTFARTDDMVRVFRWDDGDEENVEENLGDFYSDKPKQKETKPEPSPLLSKMQGILSQPSVQTDLKMKRDAREEEDEVEDELSISRRATEASQGSTKSPRGSPTSGLSQASSAAPPPKPRQPQPLKPVQKLPPRPKPKPKPPTPTPVSPVVQASPTPTPPPVTPLPDFISQFQGADWFEKYFPNCHENASARHWSADNFANNVIKLIRIGEFPVKKSVTEALMLLHTQEELSEQMTHNIFKTLISVLNHYQSPPTCMVEIEKTFILIALRALQIFAGNCIKDLVTELLMQFLDGDREVRATVLDIFSSLGVHDQHRQLQKELDSWDVWNIEENDRKAEIRRMSHQWLDRWMTSYKLHMEDTVERLKKGQNLHGRLPRGQMAKRGKASSGRLSAAGSEGPDHLPEGVDLIPRPGSDRSSIHSSRGGITVTFDAIPDSTLIQGATYIDAINYFCEMMTEKELESVRKGKRPHRKPMAETIEEKPGAPKNTVLVLPKIPQKSALVRLGESHTAHCRPKETQQEKDYRVLIAPLKRQPPPWDMQGFGPSINLPMKTVYLNPFPSAIDARDLRFQEPILITLKTSKKYFVPSQSIVPQEHLVAPSV